MTRGRIDMVRGFVVSAVGTGFSRVFGALRDISISHVFGAGMASDAFWIAYTIPNIFRRFVADEGLTGALIPAVAKAEKEGGDEEGRRLAGGALTWVLLSSGLICALGMLAAPWLVKAFAYGFTDNPEQFALAAVLTRWTLPQLLFVALVSYCEGLLNHRGHFFWPKIAPGVICGFIAASAFLLADHFQQPIMALVVGVLVGGVAHLFVCLPTMIKHWGLLLPRAVSLRDARLRSFLGEMGKVVLIGLFAQINLIVLRQLASLLAVGAVSQYWNANRIVDLAQGIIAVGVSSALMPVIARDVAEQDWKSFTEDFGRAMRLAALVLVPAGALLVAIADPVTAVLFRHGEYTVDDTRVTAMMVRMMVPFMLAVAGINIVKKVYFALEDRNTLLAVGAVGVALTAAIGWGLILEMQVAGLALALSVATVVQLAIYLLILRVRLGDRLGLGALVVPMLKLCAASGPAAAAAWAICLAGRWERGPADLVNLALLTAAFVAAVAVFAALAWLLRIPELGALVRRLRRRRDPSASA